RPFRREIAWKIKNHNELLRAHIVGIVEGEVSAFIANTEKEKDKPYLDMGAINPEQPIQFKVNVYTDNMDVELTPDSERTSDFLKVEMPDGKEGNKEVLSDGSTRKRWTVWVSYRPESNFGGPFPDKE